MKLEFLELSAESHSPDMLVIPGWGVSHTLLLPWLKKLQTLFSIRVLILPGMGAEVVEEFGEESLNGFIDSLAESISENTTLVGWSLGGNLAMQLAEKIPEKISATITLASNLKFCQSEDWQAAMPLETFEEFYQSAEESLPNCLSNFHLLCAAGDKSRKQQLKKLKDTQGLLDKTAALFWLKKLADFDQREQTVSPLLMLFAENDALVDSSVIESITESITESEYIKTAMIKNSGHMFFDSNPEECNARLIQFLQEQKVLSVRDKQAVASSFSKAAKTYDDAALLQQQVADFLLQKTLQGSGSSHDQPTSDIILDLGCGNGRASFSLQTLHAQKNVIALDIAEGMLQEASQRVDLPLLAGDAEQLPLASQSIDQIFSSLAIQWCENIDALFSELYRVMKPGTQADLSTLGPDTLQHLREAWMSIDLFEHVNRFYPLNMLKESAENAGFECLFDEEQLDYYFDDLPSLMRSLKEIGAQNQSHYRREGLTGKKKFTQLAEAYEQFRDESGLPASYQVFYLSLYKK